nr:serine dehydratase beta chain [Propionibacterium freudenreichii]
MRIKLFGSLGATGRGHGTDRAGSPDCGEHPTPSTRSYRPG